MRLLVDTNVYIDYIRDRKPFNVLATKLMVLGFLHEFELWMSASQLTDIFYILTQGGRASLVEEVKQDMRRTRQFIRICSLTEGDVDAALESTWEDFEDACVYQCACKLKVDAIVTRNQEDYGKSSLKVFNCEELFEYLEQEKGLAYDFVSV